METVVIFDAGESGIRGREGLRDIDIIVRIGFENTNLCNALSLVDSTR